MPPRGEDEPRELERHEIVGALQRALEPHAFVLALWEAGSAAWGREDRWSDLDVQVLVEDERVADAIRVVDQALAALSPVEIRFEVPQPTWHGHDQVFYRLRDAGEFRLVDLAVMRRSSRSQLAERERHGERRIAFDKTGEASPTSLDRVRHAARVAERLAQLRLTFPLFQSLVKKELLRGNPVGALAFYYSHTLQPLLTLLRIRHCPARFDFGPRYAAADLPPERMRRLQSLWFVGDAEQIESRRAEAERFFDEVVRELDAGAEPPDPRDSAPAEAVPRSIRDFLERYRDAFDRLDGEAVARLYAVPSGIVSQAGHLHWPDFESIRDNMTQLCERYRSHGYRRARYELARFLLQGERSAVVDVAWSIERAAGQAGWSFHTTYNLMRDHSGWRIVLCTAYEESPLG
jgi:hypothetical protein